MGNNLNDLITRLLAWRELQQGPDTATLIDLVCQGESMVAIASALGVTRSLVDRQIRNITVAYNFPADTRTWKAVTTQLDANYENVENQFSQLGSIEGYLKETNTSFAF